MNNSFLRMKSLLENAGISFTEEGISNAEIYAYSVGIEQVRQSLNGALSGVLANSTAGAEKYALLLNIDKSRYTAEELVEAIIKRLAQPFCKADVAEFDDAFDEVGSGSYELETDPNDGLPAIVFADVELSDLPQLARFIESYTLASMHARYDGNGMDFDGWDAWNQCFYQLDKMALPFDIIDNLTERSI